MDAISSILISKALDGLALRQSFQAQNIANANTPEYRAVEVNFEQQLQNASKKGVADIEAVSPRTSLVDQTGISSDMRLDLELAKSSQTAMRYSALIEVLGRQMALMRTVVGGGGQ